MAQFQAQIPHPLTDDLPGLLAASGMTTPAIGVLLQVFVGQSVFKRAAMQIQRHHIGSRKAALRQIGQEEFVDHAGAGHTDPTPGCPGRMGRYDDPASHAFRPQREIRTVVEGAHHPAFRMGELLIGRKFQASLDLGSLQNLIVFAPDHIRQSCEIGEDGCCAILPIQAQQGALLGAVVRFEVVSDGRHCPTQFCPVLPIARIAKSGQPLMGMGLQDCGAGAYDFPSLASRVARSAQGTQAPRWRWPICGHRQSLLAGRLARPIDVEDEEVISLSVPQSTCLLFFHERTSQQIVEEEASQGLDSGLVKRGEKAAERRTRRQALAPEERHECACPGLQPLVKGFQRPFTACGIAEQNGEKIDHFIASEAATGKAHLLFNGSKHPLALQVVSHQRHLPEPRRC